MEIGGRDFLGIALATASLGIALTTAFLGIALETAFLGIALAIDNAAKRLVNYVTKAVIACARPCFLPAASRQSFWAAAI